MKSIRKDYGENTKVYKNESHYLAGNGLGASTTTIIRRVDYYQSTNNRPENQLQHWRQSPAMVFHVHNY